MTTSTKIGEIWKPIKNFENSHHISNLGRVKSLARQIPCQNGFRISTTKILKQKTLKSGYKCIQLERKGKLFLVHRLVAEAFIPNPEYKPQVNHINGIKGDNRAFNLEWVTRSENQYHAYNTGLQTPSYHQRARGEDAARSKLTKEQVIEIRQTYVRGEAIRMGKRYKVSQTTILNIINRKTWKHL